MADEAFALSPISARAAMPSDADYDAIREAFMETSRGRWFLSEYAKRNRNADTRMVLDAVARIEQNLAAQKQASGTSLSESLVAIRAIVGEARAQVAKSIVGLENDAVLNAARDGARIIREVSWTLRECGADVRICNLLDSQVLAIDAGQRLITEIDSRAVLAAFDGLLDHIHDLAGEPRPHRPEAAPVDEEPASPVADGDLSEAAAAAEPAAVSPPLAAAAPAPAPAAIKAAADPAVTIVTGTAAEELEFVEAGEPHVAAEEPSATEIDNVDSMLDLVALEMSAPQPDDPSELEAAIEAARLEAEQATEAAPEVDPQSEIAQLAAEVALAQEPAPDLPVADAVPSIAEAPTDHASSELPSFEFGERGEPLYVTQSAPEPFAAQPASPVMAASPVATASPTVAAATAPEPIAPPTASASPSLGAALLASGIVGQSGQPRGDALAPLRRMSQPEKIAFFS